MKLLDYTFSSPEENLACDEALLDLVEDGRADEIFRLWESPRHFVVLGSSNKIHQEIFIEKCEADGIPILRRHSGGGTVLQGPGCLNFSLILRIDPGGPTRNITDTTNHIMSRHADVFSNLLHENVEVRGSSDLAITGRKFSGNAQRRKLKALLFHGTFLLNFNLELIEKYLKLPPKQPEYREQRSHLDFVTNIGSIPSIVNKELRKAWNADTPLAEIPSDRIQALVEEKYSKEEWNFKM
ncbi:MAG: lipoate--protein ligase family protein [Bacteroidetes bacterium]|nr:lipoate--protein ligase family protein [Bacteroidota bacterium]